MNIIVTPNPSALRRVDQKGKIVVVIDVLRACTTIVHALSQGCKAFYPLPSIKKAREKQRRLKTQAGTNRTETLLCGERNGLKIKGFDLGNSPLEYTPEAVRNKNIVFTTSNCTKNLDACRQPKETLICTLLNVHHVAHYLSKTNDDLIIATSGREGDFSLEDAACAGMLIDELHNTTRRDRVSLPTPQRRGGVSPPSLSDLSHVCRTTYLQYKDNLIDALADSTHGRILKGIGLEADIKFCAQVGKYEILPVYTRGRILPSRKEPRPLRPSEQ